MPGDVYTVVVDIGTMVDFVFVVYSVVVVVVEPLNIQ